MKSYLCLLLVQLSEPYLIEGERLIGYWINVCVDAEDSSEASSLAEQLIADGIVDWSESEVYEANRNTVKKSILEKRPPKQVKGIWYKSGRAFFPKS